MTEIRKYLILIVLICSTISFGQSDPSDECRDGWDAQIGTVNISPERDDCTYEIEDWDNPNGVGLNIAPLLTPNTNIKHFQFRSDVSEIDREEFYGGKFKTFEVVAASGDVIFSVEFEWGGTVNSSMPMTISAVVNNVFSPFRDSLPVVFGTYEASPGETEFEIQYSWKPSTGVYANGWVELYVNGEFVAKKYHLRLTTSGLYAPHEVYYGVVEPPPFPRPEGKYKFTPRNPTPRAFHL